MNQTQFYISVAVMPVTTIIIVMIGVLLNNSNLNSRLNSLDGRLASMEGSFNQRIDDFRDMLRAEMAKNYSELMAKFAELDTRLSRIEGHLNLS